MKKQHAARQGGFTLIELMIVIAIVGILAAIALPAYQDYTIRAKMSEVLAVAAEAKTTIAEFAATNGRMPSTTQSAGITQGNFGAQSFVSFATLTDVSANALTYQLTATSNSQELGAAAGMLLDLEGTLNQTTRRVNWVCGPNDAALSKYLPASCRG